MQYVLRDPTQVSYAESIKLACEHISKHPEFQAKKGQAVNDKDERVRVAVANIEQLLQIDFSKPVKVIELKNRICENYQNVFKDMSLFSLNSTLQTEFKNNFRLPVTRFGYIIDKSARILSMINKIIKLVSAKNLDTAFKVVENFIQADRKLVTDIVEPFLKAQEESENGPHMKLLEGLEKKQLELMNDKEKVEQYLHGLKYAETIINKSSLERLEQLAISPRKSSSEIYERMEQTTSPRKIEVISPRKHGSRKSTGSSLDKHSFSKYKKASTSKYQKGLEVGKRNPERIQKNIEKAQFRLAGIETDLLGVKNKILKKQKKIKKENKVKGDFAGKKGYYKGKDNQLISHRWVRAALASINFHEWTTILGCDPEKWEKYNKKYKGIERQNAIYLKKGQDFIRHLETKTNVDILELHGSTNPNAGGVRSALGMVAEKCFEILRHWKDIKDPELQEKAGRLELLCSFYFDLQQSIDVRDNIIRQSKVTEKDTSKPNVKILAARAATTRTLFTHQEEEEEDCAPCQQSGRIVHLAEKPVLRERSNSAPSHKTKYERTSSNSQLQETIVDDQDLPEGLIEMPEDWDIIFNLASSYVQAFESAEKHYNALFTNETYSEYLKKQSLHNANELISNITELSDLAKAIKEDLAKINSLNLRSST